ncbi:MAG TPA: phosphoribosyltransferase family protein [Actinomycetota bacterium]|jgi:putative phosphoribosyl transferase
MRPSGPAGRPRGLDRWRCDIDAQPWRGAVPRLGRRPFADRVEAGDRLAQVLAERVVEPVTILAIPRGGAVVAARVARRLGAALDVVVPRKLAAPDNPELAVGALADGVEAIDPEAAGRLGLDPDALRAEVERQRAEVARRTAAYRGGRPPPDLAGRTAVLVDDGVATGWTSVAAASWCRQRGAGRVVLAVPVGPARLAERLGSTVDEAIVLETPQPYVAVAQAFASFPQVTDEEVLACLRWREEPRR